MSFGNILLISVIAEIALSTLWGLIFKKKALIRLISISIVAALTFVITFSLKKFLTEPDALIKLMSKVPGLEDALAKVSEMIASSGELTHIIQVLLSAAAAPLLFLIVFSSLTALSYFLRFILSLIFFRKKKGKIYRGAIYGFIYGVILMFCILVPVSAYIEVAETALPETKEMDFMSEELYQKIEEPVSSINSSLAIRTHRSLGGKLISDSLTKINLTVGEEKITTTLAPELGHILRFANDAMALAKTPMAQYTEKETAALETLAEDLKNSKIASATASEIVYLATDAWCKGEAFMGIPKPSFNEDFNPLIDKMFEILHEDSRNVDYLCEDITTFAKMLSKILSVNLNGEQGIQNALTADGLVRDILTEINKNERMRPLIPIVTNIGLKMIAESLGFPESATDAFNTLSSDISAELIKGLTDMNSHEIRVNNMEAALCESLEKLNVTGISDTETRIIAMALVENFTDSASATPENVAAFLSSITSAASTSSSNGNVSVSASGNYGTAPLSVAQNGVEPEKIGALLAEICKVQSNTAFSPDEKVMKILQLTEAASLDPSELSSKVLADAENRTAADATASLNAVIGLNPDSTTSSYSATVELILVDTTVFDEPNAVSEAELEAIINSVSDVFETVMGLMGSDMTVDDIGKMFESLGGILTALEQSEGFYGKAKTEKLLEVLLKSSLCKEKIGVSAADVDAFLTKKSENNVGYTAIMTTVSKTTKVLDTVANGGQITDSQISELITSLTTEGSGEVIATVITEDRFKQMGFASDTNSGKAGAAASLISDVFTNVSNVTDETEHEAEVGAVKQLIEIAIDAKSNTDATKNAFGEEGRLGCTAGELLDNVIASDSVCGAINSNTTESNPFGIKLTAEDQSALSSELNARISEATQAGDADTAVTLSNIGTLFGLT